MIDTSFDINQWMLWLAGIYWFKVGIGILSAAIAFFGFRPGQQTDTRIPAFLIALILLFLLGLFPIEWGYSTDRANYANTFINIQQDGFGSSGNRFEIGFQVLCFICGKFCTPAQFFFIISLIYLGNYMTAITRLADKNSYWLFICVVLSMGFTNYNTNTMRAGLAISFVVLALSKYPSVLKMAFCMAVASSLHKSSMIPSMMIMISYFFNKTRLFYVMWFLAIPISFVFGGTFMALFADISDDQRTSYLTKTLYTTYNTGFRIDFLLYSLAPIATGAYFLFIRQYKSKFYHLIYNSYILTNIFWILVIKANYSDRFAYLSWFMMPFVLLYPLIHKPDIVDNPKNWIAAILIGETLFSIMI